MTRQEYIEAIASYVVKWCPEYGVKVASPIIAQAIVEGLYWNNSTNRSELSVLAEQYHNYFGMKCGSDWSGKSVNLDTYEEFTVGTMTLIQDNFRVYDSMEEGVKGYFEFIKYSRYKNLHETSDPYTYITRLKEDGYATASAYVDLLWQIVKQENLTRFDSLIGTSETVIITEEPKEQKVIVSSGKPSCFSTDVYGDYHCVVPILNVRTDAGTDNLIITSIFEGTPVMCNGFYTDIGDSRWLEIQFYGLDGNVYRGFACEGGTDGKYLEVTR